MILCTCLHLTRGSNAGVSINHICQLLRCARCAAAVGPTLACLPAALDSTARTMSVCLAPDPGGVVQARGLGGCNVQSLELEPDTSIKHIMELMRDKTEISVSKQRMMFDGHRLLPFQTLEELGVEDADQLNILEEQRAGQHTYADNSNAGKQAPYAGLLIVCIRTVCCLAQQRSPKQRAAVEDARCVHNPCACSVSMHDPTTARQQAQAGTTRLNNPCLLTQHSLHQMRIWQLQMSEPSRQPLVLLALLEIRYACL